MNDVPAYDVELTDEAYLVYESIETESLFRRLDKDLESLGRMPYLGREYDPAYPAARPNFACRVLYCSYLGIYYRVDEDRQRVVVYSIEDQRRDPKLRFTV